MVEGYFGLLHSPHAHNLFDEFLQRGNMRCLLKCMQVNGAAHLLRSFYCTRTSVLDDEVQEMCKTITCPVGGLDELELRLDGFSNVHLTSKLVNQILEVCKQEAPSRRILRFFLWSRKMLGCELSDEDFNCAIRVLAEMKDCNGMQILIEDLRKEERVMEEHTFGVVAETMVKLGREDDALGIFKNLYKFNCPQNDVTVAAIVSALCAKGHAKKAQGVVLHHRDKILGVESCVYRSILYGWSVQKDVKEARKVMKEMRVEGIMPDLFCYNTLLRCVCERNVTQNPSGLVPEALNVMMEMRSYRIEPNTISYNMLLSCLGRTRRVKESLKIVEVMKTTGCDPDWVSYFLVVKVLYLTGRFGKGNQMVDEMIEKGLVPDRKFYYDLIGVLCGVERVNFALELFERMKRGSLGGYGPVYDVLIPKLCRGGNFDKGRELWDEATAMGATLCCSSDVLDPIVTEVFEPTRKVQEEVRLKDFIRTTTKPRTRTQVKKSKGNVSWKMNSNKNKKKSA